MRSVIDVITAQQQETSGGKKYDTIRVWIGGVPFSADLTQNVESLCRRLSIEQNVDFIDRRLNRPA